MDILILPYVSTITVAGDVGDITKYTSPLKLFEYMSTGIPIIASTIGSIGEVVDEIQDYMKTPFKKPLREPFEETN